MSGSTPERLEQLRLVAKSNLVRDAPGSSADRRKVNVKRVNDALKLLKEVVPGLDEKADKVETYEMVLKYTMFLKAKVGADCDEDFINEYLK